MILTSKGKLKIEIVYGLTAGYWNIYHTGASSFIFMYVVIWTTFTTWKHLTVHETKNNLCIFKVLQINIRHEIRIKFNSVKFSVKSSQSFTQFGQKIQIFFEYDLRNDLTASVRQTTPIGHKLVDVRHPVETVIKCLNKTNQAYYRREWTLLELQNSKRYFRRNVSVSFDVIKSKC